MGQGQGASIVKQEQDPETKKSLQKHSSRLKNESHDVDDSNSDFTAVIANQNGEEELGSEEQRIRNLEESGVLSEVIGSQSILSQELLEQNGMEDHHHSLSKPLGAEAADYPSSGSEKKNLTIKKEDPVEPEGGRKGDDYPSSGSEKKNLTLKKEDPVEPKGGRKGDDCPFSGSEKKNLTIKKEDPLEPEGGLKGDGSPSKDEGSERSVRRQDPMDESTDEGRQESPSAAHEDNTSHSSSSSSAEKTHRKNVISQDDIDEDFGGSQQSLNFSQSIPFSQDLLDLDSQDPVLMTNTPNVAKSLDRKNSEEKNGADSSKDPDLEKKLNTAGPNTTNSNDILSQKDFVNNMDSQDSAVAPLAALIRQNSTGSYSSNLRRPVSSAGGNTVSSEEEERQVRNLDESGALNHVAGSQSILSQELVAMGNQLSQQTSYFPQEAGEVEDRSPYKVAKQIGLLTQEEEVYSHEAIHQDTKRPSTEGSCNLIINAASILENIERRKVKSKSKTSFDIVSSTKSRESPSLLMCREEMEDETAIPDSVKSHPVKRLFSEKDDNSKPSPVVEKNKTPKTPPPKTARSTGLPKPSESTVSTPTKAGSANRRRTKEEREAEKQKANRIAKDAASLAQQTISSPELAKQLLLSMALVRENPRTEPSDWPPKGSEIPHGFFWGRYPPLEYVLRSSMREYYELSTKQCQSKAQQAFNNRLVDQIREEARKYEWEFHPDTFDDKKIRDRIRCYFKTHIQNAKKRLRTMMKNPTKKANAKALAKHLELIQKYNDKKRDEKYRHEEDDAEDVSDTKNPPTKKRKQGNNTRESEEEDLPAKRNRARAQSSRLNTDEDALHAGDEDIRAAEVMALGFARLSQDMQLNS